MTSSPQSTTSPQPSAKRNAVLGLLIVSWFATPILFFGAAIVGAPFFGETPSPEEMNTSKQLLAAAIATGFAAPAIATVLSLRWQQRPIAWIAGGELVVAVAAVVWLFAKTQS